LREEQPTLRQDARELDGERQQPSGEPFRCLRCGPIKTSGTPKARTWKPSLIRRMAASVALSLNTEKLPVACAQDAGGLKAIALASADFCYFINSYPCPLYLDKAPIRSD
jgi:hypothetical protein